MSFLVLSGLWRVVSRDSENRSYYHRFANMIRDSEKNVKLFSRKFAKILKTDVILAKITKNVKLFFIFLQFARVYRAIDGNYTRNSIFCQRFFAKKVSKKI